MRRNGSNGMLKSPPFDAALGESVNFITFKIVLSREKLSAILARVISEPEMHGVDVAPEGTASGKASVVATPETGSLIMKLKQTGSESL